MIQSLIFKAPLQGLAGLENQTTVSFQAVDPDLSLILRLVEHVNQA